MSVHGMRSMSLCQMGFVGRLAKEKGVDFVGITKEHMQRVHGSRDGKTELLWDDLGPKVLKESDEHIIYLVEQHLAGKGTKFPGDNE